MCRILKYLYINNNNIVCAPILLLLKNVNIDIPELIFKLQ